MLVMMAAGYAAFASNLIINGTSEVTSNWCLGFDSTIQNPYTARAGITNGTVPTASVTYNGNVCESSYNTGVNLSATMKQPGDEVVYTLTIKNASSLDAAIESITVNNQNTVSNKEVKIGNIVFIVGMPESTSLSAGDSTTMTVTARFQDETDITGNYEGESANLTVKINASQDGGTGGFEKKFSGYIYRHNSNQVYQTLGGKNFNMNGYVYASSTGSIGPQEIFDTIEDCRTKYTDGSYYCQLASNALGTFTTNKSEIQNNYTYYLKHKIEDDIMTASYVCFVMGGKEKCLKGYNNASNYISNQEILREYQNFYNLSEISNSSPSNPGCSYGESNSACYGGSIYGISLNNQNPYVYGSAGVMCYVSDNSFSRCTS